MAVTIIQKEWPQNLSHPCPYLRIPVDSRAELLQQLGFDFHPQIAVEFNPNSKSGTKKAMQLKWDPKYLHDFLMIKNDLLHYILNIWKINFKATACQQEFVRGCLGVLFLAFHFAVMSTGCWLLMLPRLHGEPNPKVPMFQKVCGIDRCCGFSSQEREIPCCCFLFGDGNTQHYRSLGHTER